MQVPGFLSASVLSLHAAERLKKMKTLTTEEGGTQGSEGCLLNCQPEHLLPHHTGVQVRSYVLFLFLTVTQKVP